MVRECRACLFMFEILLIQGGVDDSKRVLKYWLGLVTSLCRCYCMGKLLVLQHGWESDTSVQIGKSVPRL